MPHITMIALDFTMAVCRPQIINLMTRERTLRTRDDVSTNAFLPFAKTDGNSASCTLKHICRFVSLTSFFLLFLFLSFSFFVVFFFATHKRLTFFCNFAMVLFQFLLSKMTLCLHYVKVLLLFIGQSICLDVNWWKVVEEGAVASFI